MPQKGQTTKHEWECLGNGICKCKNCPTWAEEKRDMVIYKQGSKRPVKKRTTMHHP